MSDYMDMSCTELDGVDTRVARLEYLLRRIYG